MSAITVNRRTLMSATALVSVVPAVTLRAASSQTPGPVPGQSWTTTLFDREITWGEPWTRDEGVEPVLELELIDTRIDTVVGTLFYDSLVLQHPNGAITEISFVPTPGVDRSWDIPFRLRAEDADIDIESESSEELFYYGLRFFVNGGVEYGRVTTFTDPSQGVSVEAFVLSAPASELGATLRACQDSIAIDGEQPFPMFDPDTVQAMLDPLIGTGIRATPES